MAAKTDTQTRPAPPRLPTSAETDLASQLFGQEAVVVSSEPDVSGYPFLSQPADPLTTTPPPVFSASTPTAQPPQPSSRPQDPVSQIAFTLLSATPIPASHHPDLAREVLGTGKLTPAARETEITKLLGNQAPNHIIKELASLAGAAYGKPDTDTLHQAATITAKDPANKLPEEHSSLSAENLYESVSAQLEQQTQLPRDQIHPEVQQIALSKILLPSASPEDYAAVVRAQTPKLEAKAGRRHVDLDSQPIAAHLSQFNARAQGDQLILQSLESQAIAAGLGASTASQFASASLEHMKISYFLSGYASEAPSDPKKGTPEQRDAFLRFRRYNLDQTVSQLLKKPDSASKMRSFNETQFSYEQARQALEAVYGNPTSMTPPSSEGLANYTAPLGSGPEAWLPTPLKFVFQRFFASYVGIKVVNSEIGRKLGLRAFADRIGYSIPLKYRPLGVFSKIPSRGYTQGMRIANRWMRMQYAGNKSSVAVYKGLSSAGNAVKTSLKGAGRTAVNKLSQTAAGKALVAAGAKLAATSAVKGALQGLAAVLEPVLPFIGHLLAWLVGEVVVRLGEKILLPIWKIFRDYVVPVFAGLLAFGFTGSALAGVAIGGATWGTAALLSGGSAGLAGAAAAASSTIVAITSATAVAIATPILIATLATPIVLAFFLFIINSSAYVVPPSYLTLISGAPGSPGGFANRSGCPLINGRITTYSYDPNLQEEYRHGSNRYWRGQGLPYCRYHMPADGRSCGPTQGTTNYCIDPANYNCSSGGNAVSNPFYGWAIDVVSDVDNSTVSLPLVNGQTIDWTYEGNPYHTSAGYAHNFRSTDGQYFLHLMHMNQAVAVTVSQAYPSGTRVGTLFNQGSNTHIHIEFYVNGVIQKPENYFCN